jgi:hypothetical protein
MGVITGGMLVDGRERDTSFQRKTGWFLAALGVSGFVINNS